MKTKDSGVERGDVEVDEEENVVDDEADELPTNGDCDCELEVPEADSLTTICARSAPAIELLSFSNRSDYYGTH